MKKIIRNLLMLFASIVGLGLNVSFAQDSASPVGTTDNSAGQLEDIIVTAQRRRENLQDVPIAVTAISGQSLIQQGLIDTDSLSGAVPGLTFTRIGPAGTPFIRGVGSASGDPNAEPSVATYVDGVYMAVSNGNVFEFNNVDSVEVLKGPQGTLFGRNATGGVILVNTRNPTFDEIAEARLGYANYGTVNGEAYVNTKITDELAFNVAGHVRDQGTGYGNNLTTGQETYKSNDASVRAKVLFQPNPDTQAILSGDYTSDTSASIDYTLPNGAIGRDGMITSLRPYNTRGNDLDSLWSHVGGGSLTINSSSIQWFDVRSITAYRRSALDYYADVDTTPGNFLNVAPIRPEQHNFSQEIHFLSKEDAKVKWLVGAFYYDSTAGDEPTNLTGSDVGNILVSIDGVIRTHSTSPFAQATVEVLPATNLTVGGRYTFEHQSFSTITDSSVGVLSPLQSADQSFSKPTWHVSLDHKFGDDIRAYVSDNRGIKSGSYGPQSPPSGVYKPEQIDAYEVGVKTELFEHRLRLNASAFWYQQKDLQVQVIRGGAGGAATYTENAANARTRGLDFDFEARPIESFTVSGGLAYLDGKYTKYPDASSFLSAGAGPLSVFDATGKTLVKAPKVSGSITAAYTIPAPIGAFNVSATAIYTDKFYFAADNRPYQPSYTILNSTLRWTANNQRFSVDLWGRNLVNKIYLQQVLESNNGDLTTYGNPRTYGISFEFKL